MRNPRPPAAGPLALALTAVLAFALSLVLPLAGGARPAEAADGPRCFGTVQYDLDEDGRPDLMVIDCAFATERDFVYVYDRGGNMRPAEQWRDAADFRDDTWLFDVGADGSFDLAIVFAQEGGRDVAYLYDDQDGDGKVSVRRAGRQAIIDESPFWTARIESGSTWTRPDGSLNHNVRVLVDGPLPRFGFPESYLRELRTSGQPKWETGIVDADEDGIPEYGYSLLLAPSPATSQLSRTGFAVNSGRYRPRPADGFLFWPLLGGAPWYDSANYFDSPLHVSYDWNRRRLLEVAVSGYPIEEGYHINTLQYAQRGRLNYADFENPMAYYDLAGDRDGRPELFIRMAYFGQGVPIEEITYSWNQYNTANLNWHFKLGLLGRHPVQSQAQIGDFTVQTVPHHELPRWVTDRPWEIATFVADEGGAYNSSEGIYEWAPLEGVIPDASAGRTPLPDAGPAVADFLVGRSAVSPAPYFDTIRAAFRAEYREAPGPVELYYSPIDRRLHLLKASKGVWNLTGGRELRYASTGGDYLDHWSLRQGGQEQRALWHAADQLVLSDEDGVRLRRTTLSQALYTTPPPVDRETYQRLAERLGASEGPEAAAGADPRAMFDRIPGPVQVIPGARARDLRVTPEGFRFVLGLPGGGPAGAPLGAGLPPGEYLVSYSAGAYRVEPLSPSVLTLGVAVDRQASPGAIPAGAAPGAPDTAYEVRQPLNIAVRVVNGGQDDARGLLVQLVAAATPAGTPAGPPVGTSAGTSEQVVGNATLDAQAGTSSVLSFVWTPPAPGGWTLRARAVKADGETAEASAPLPVRPEPPLTARALLTPQAPVVTGVLALLVGMGAIAVLATVTILASLPASGAPARVERALASDPGRGGNGAPARVEATSRSAASASDPGRGGNGAPEGPEGPGQGGGA